MRLALILPLLFPLLAWGNPVSAEQVTARLVAERMAVAPGESADLLLVLDIRPGWHTYWTNPGDSGEPPGIDWTLPPGVTAGPLQFTVPELIRVGPLANFGYSARALHPVSIEIPGDWPVGEAIPIRARAHWLVCEDYCIPESAVLELTLPVGGRAGERDPAVSDLFAAARDALPQGSLSGAVMRESENGSHIEVPFRDRLPRPVSVRFFPSQWGLIEHAAEQPWRLTHGKDGTRLELDLTLGPLGGRVDPSGLLVIGGADGVRRGFDLTSVRHPGSATIQADPSPLGLPLALGFAFLGGLILNLMPCVFPVLAIKALSLAGQRGLGLSGRVLHGLSYTAGVLVFFGVLTGLLLALRAGGVAVGWGFQLQYSPFVAAMAYLFLVLGLGLSGALTLGVGLMGVGGGASASDQGARAAFGTGALAALVAAPCTAPFMGTALGYAVTLPWPQSLAILLTLGLGLAAPFLLLSLWPALAERMPRPGPWMEVLRQILAFPLFATAAWLVWVLSVQSGPRGVALVLAGMLILSFGLWARERTLTRPRPWVGVGLAASVTGLAGALWLALLTDASGTPDTTTPKGEVEVGALYHEPYSAERLAAARTEGRPVLVNMTAAWCVTCLVNEQVALSNLRVVELLRARGILYLKGDWTNRDPAITDYLAGFGRSGVPLYVLYPEVGEPLVLPQILTPSIVESAIASLGDPNPRPSGGESP